ncbi:hypothetical protein ASD11_08775 [Aeromicrobium sp. Root495]|uniref:helix-turn-helix domain-containing protein n=1 Tax=Aeromicrobium sp. Root495 TaxID=1736550 RepID=UPI0006FD9543|nr:helix-turn-helix domain-containing protein [Aeromicrobium sp. Root495]KQY59632.1 hypothetical protein ASD11_08775 [Aeromicrobium sp. Root495]
MFALTIDQRSSRRTADAVPELVAALNEHPLVRSFERTAGDEVQGLTDRPDVVVDILVELARRQTWWAGVGVGAVEDDLPDSVRASRGPALVAARDAVERAKHATAGVAVSGAEGLDASAVEDVETAAQALGLLVGARSLEGHQAVAAVAEGVTQSEAARRLGISPQAMSRRLQVARWDDEARLRRLVQRLLERVS